MSHIEKKPTGAADFPPVQLAWRVREFCEAHRISHSTFWKYVKNGQIKVIRIGGRVLVPLMEVERISREGM